MAPDRPTLERLVAGDPLTHLDDPDPETRRLAVVACRRLGSGALKLLAGIAQSDEDEHVRADAVEVLGSVGPSGYEAVAATVSDGAVRVVEAAATALGEIGDARAVPWLLEQATGDGDGLVREAAIAALGSIGDERALPALLEIAGTGRPQLRRRAVVALTAFEGPEVEAAFTAARLDRNPMVREVAEMVIGRPDPKVGRPELP